MGIRSILSDLIPDRAPAYRILLAFSGGAIVSPGGSRSDGFVDDWLAYFLTVINWPVRSIISQPAAR